MLQLLLLLLQETWTHQEHFDWDIAGVYAFIHKLADCKMSTRSELEEMFSYLSGRHKHDNIKKGPWQTEERIFFHNTLLHKRVPETSAEPMRIKPADFSNAKMRTAKTGKHWFSSDCTQGDRRMTTIKQSALLSELASLCESGVKSGMHCAPQSL